MITTLREFFSAYVSDRDLSVHTITAYNNALNVFEKHYGKPLPFADLEPKIAPNSERQVGDLILNKWLEEYSKSVRPDTVKTRRATILALLADAFDAGVTTYRRIKVRAPKCPETPKDVWSPAEVSRLINSCDCLTRRFQKTQIRRDYFAKSLLMAAWDTGLRRADLIRIKWDWLRDSHIFSIVAQKTGKSLVCRVSKETRNLLLLTFDQFAGDDRECCWPIWQSPGRFAERSVTDLFRDPLRISGLDCSDGIFKKLRRSSGTYQKINGGDPTEHLGHSSDAVTKKHYLNQTAIRRETEIILPPSLALG